MTTTKKDNQGSSYRDRGVFERGEKPQPKSKQLRLYDEKQEALDDDAFLDSVMRGAYNGSRSSARSFGFMGTPKPMPVFPKRDSFTDPYAMDFLPAESTGTTYSLGMGMHPGRKDAGTKADWNRDLRADFSRIWEAGVRTIVCMVEAHEFDLLKVPDYVREAETFGFDVIWFPVRDVSTPVSFRLMHKVCYEVWGRLQAGNVLVHCRGGKGRTGTLACCLLELLGWSSDASLKLVRSVRKGTVETQGQEKWCENFEGYVHAIRRRRDELGADS